MRRSYRQAALTLGLVTFGMTFEKPALACFANTNALFQNCLLGIDGDPSIDISVDIPMANAVVGVNVPLASIQGPGSLSGAGSFTKLGAGTLIFNIPFTPTYTGATFISAGTLQAGAMDTFSQASSMNVSSGATLDLNGFDQTLNAFGAATGSFVDLGSATLTVGIANATVGINGVVSGTGQIRKAGTGLLQLAGDNTFTGGITFEQGNIWVYHANALGTGDLNVMANNVGLAGFANVTIMNNINLNNFTLATNSSVGIDDFVIGGVISGTGGIRKSAGGILTFSGANTYTGNTNINAGTLRAGATNTFSATSGMILGANTTLDLNGFDQTLNRFVVTQASSTINLANGAILTTGDTAVDFNINSSLIGTGGLTKQNGRMVTLNQAATYTGATQITGGTLRAGGANVFSADSATSLTGGTLDLNNLNQTIHDLSNTGGLIALGGATLTTGSANDNTIAGGLQGSAASVLLKEGTGTLTLGGLNPFNGLARVTEGTLNLTGSIAGNGLVSGGRLAGTGVIGGNLTLDSGSVAPGSAAALGTLTVNGDYVQNGGALTIKTDGTAADLLDIAGSATLGGTLNVLGIGGADQFDLGQIMNAPYTVLNAAAGVTGTFANVTDNLAFLNAVASYGANDVQIGFVEAGIAAGSFAETDNQEEVAAALDAIQNGNPTAAEQALLDLLMPLTNDEVAEALDRLSNQAAGAGLHLQQRQLDLFYERVRGSLNRGEGGIARPQTAFLLQSANAGASDVAQLASLPAMAGGSMTSGLWGDVYGGGGSLDGDHGPGSGDTDYGLAGIAFGYDLPLFETVKTGLSLGYSHGWADIDQLEQEADADSVTLAGYGRYQDGGAELDGFLGLGWQGVSTRRDVQVGAFDETAKGDYDAFVFSLGMEGRYWFDLGDQFLLAPEAGLFYHRIDKDGYREHGAGPANLRVSGEVQESVQSTLGVTARRDFAVDGVKLTPEVGIAWLHEFGDTEREVESRFQVGGPAFATDAADTDRNQALLTLGLNAELSSDLTLGAGYLGRYSGDEQQHGAHLGLSWKW